MFSLPPVNHLANGRSHSSVVSNGSNQSIRSRASLAQKASKSASASRVEVRRGVGLGGEGGAGGNVRVSARRFSISGEVESGLTLTDPSIVGGWPGHSIVPSRCGPHHQRTIARQGRVRRRSALHRAGPARPDGRGPGRGRRVAAAGSRCRSPRSASSRRLRNSPAAAHWSAARTEPRILSVIPNSPRASTRSTRGASRIRRRQTRLARHLAADLVDHGDGLVDVGAVRDRHVLVDP